jgi:uncharacterized protein YpmS
MKINKVIPLIIFAFMLSMLACNLSFPWGSSREPVPVTTEAAESLEETVEGVFENPQLDDEITLVITETQFTSIIAFKLEELAGEIITNPQVYLQNGQIQLTGDVSTQGISAPAQVDIEVSVDVVGRPVLNVASATVGPFPIPGDLVSEVEVIINDAFQDQIDSMAPNLHIESIIIEDGTMTIIGRTK